MSLGRYFNSSEFRCLFKANLARYRGYRGSPLYKRPSTDADGSRYGFAPSAAWFSSLLHRATLKGA